MLAARLSAARSASRVVRGFATVVDTAGLKVAAVDNGQPTSAVTILIKAGSRFETKPGVAHVLKNFAFKSTAKRSALGTVREAELYGGVLSTSLTREHLAITAEFLRGDEPLFVELLTSLIASPKYTRYELEESVIPTVEAEVHNATSNPGTHALELAHALAFRSGLGHSLFAPSPDAITSDDVKSYASTAFGKGNIAILGTGIDQAVLSKLIEKNLGSALSTGASASSPSSKYFGGETRILSHNGPETIFIGFGTTGPSSAELAVLAAHLSPRTHVKWAQSTSPIAAALPEGTSVQTVILPYSDAVLFGLLVQGETTKAVTEAAKVATKALKDAAAAGGVKAEDLKKAVAKAKFLTASAVDNRDGLIFTLGPKLLSGSETSVDSLLSSLDKVDASAFSKAATSLIKAKPTIVAVGDTTSLPHADDLGF